MNGKIAVSVIVPVFNVERYLSRCIDSILNQTLKNIEIILIDDGSTDGSLSICKKYENENNNIKVLHQENMGLTAVRRNGLALAEGEYAIFVDSDDYISEEMCEEMYNYCKKNNYLLLISDYYLVKENSCTIEKGFHGDDFSIKKFYESISPGFVWNKMYHRSLFERMKVNINVNQAEDICMLLPLLSSLTDDEVGYIKIPFYFYVIREDSNSNSNLFTKNCCIDEYLLAIKYILNNHKPEYRNYVIYYCVQCIYWGINNPEKKEFKADYIEFLQKELAPYIVGNPLLVRFSEMGKDIVTPIIPANIYFVNYSESIDNIVIDEYVKKFKNYKIHVISDEFVVGDNCPKCVENALENGNVDFAKEFFAVRQIYENGGIFISSNVKLSKSLGEVRIHRAFVGYKNETEIGMDIWGSMKYDAFISKMYESYFEDSIYNDKAINLATRANIILQKFFKLKLKGKECFLMANQVKIYEADKFYMRINSKYISYLYDELDAIAEKQGKVVVDYETYQKMIDRMYSEFKNDYDHKNGYDELTKINELEQEVINYKSMYETVLNSTCWRITKPIRLILDFFKK